MMLFSHKKIILVGSFLAAICFAGLVYRGVQAQQAVPTPSDDQVNAVARQLYCPVCENISLDVCPTTACAQWRDLIKQKIAAGWSTNQIKDYFVTQYGDRVLAEPPRRGINWLIYVVPPILILIAVFIFVSALRRMHKAAPAATADQPVQTNQPDDYLKRVEQDLNQRK